IALSGADFCLQEEKSPPITRSNPIQQNSSLIIFRPFVEPLTLSNSPMTNSELSVAAMTFRMNALILSPIPRCTDPSPDHTFSYFPKQDSDPEAEIALAA